MWGRPHSVPNMSPILSPIWKTFLGTFYFVLDCHQYGKRFWGHNWGHFIPSLNWVYIVIYRHHILSGTGWGDWGRPHIWGRIWGQDGDRISVAGDRKNCPWGRNPLGYDCNSNDFHFVPYYMIYWCVLQRVNINFYVHKVLYFRFLQRVKSIHRLEMHAIWMIFILSLTTSFIDAFCKG